MIQEITNFKSESSFKDENWSALLLGEQTARPPSSAEIKVNTVQTVK